MTSRLRVHGPTIRGRLRSDRGLLLLMGLVVATTVAVTAAVAPLTERTADRAMAQTVRDAGPRGAVVATLPESYDDPRGKKRAPHSVVELRQDAVYARSLLPPSLAGVLRPGVATLTTPPLHLLDAGPGRYLRLAYVDGPGGPPAVSYTAGGPPQASVGPGREELTLPRNSGPWTVQVALSEAAAEALDLAPGDRVTAADEQNRSVRLRISGVYAAEDPGADAWSVVSELLTPSQGVSDGVERTAAAALVSPEALPDLRLAMPSDDLTHRVVFTPQASRVTSRGAPSLQRAVGALQTSAGLVRDHISWSSLLDRVLEDGRTQVSAARGQAQVLLVGLLAGALLVLVLAAQLLVRRRRAPVAMARERGASLLGLGVELLVESVAVSVAGAALGLGTVWLFAGGVGWGWAVPVVAVATLASPLLGALEATRAADVRKVPANRAARRTAARAVVLRRLGFEVAVLAAAVLSLVALRQRGVLGGDVTAAGAGTWLTLLGGLVVLRLVPLAVRLLLRAARRSTGGVPFLVGARLGETAARALPLLAVTVAVAQLTVGVALAATEQQGQASGALLSVGGDARLTVAPSADVAEQARRVGASPGVTAAAAGRVADGVRISSRSAADRARLVVVDAADYERLISTSALPDAPGLALLGEGGGGPVPALLLGGDADLRDGLVVAWEDARVPLEVVGTAPSVGAAGDPVVVVDADAFAAAGAVALPDTVWAVGPGAAAAVSSAAGPDAALARYDDELAARRDAPLASGLVRLAVAVSVLMLLFAALAVVLAAATEAPARAESLGRLRALGLRDRDLRRVLAGELLTPVLVATLTGLALGLACAHLTFGSLSLERITGQPSSPPTVVPLWTGLAALALLAVVVVVAAVEWRRLRRRVLAELLRS